MKAIQAEAIDIKDWIFDDRFSPYPEGAREKLAFFPPENLNLKFIRPDRRYLFKYPPEWAPDQFWAEIIAYHIGVSLGVKVPPAYAAYNSNTKECAALIEWFYRDNTVTYFQGGNLFEKLVDKDFDHKRGKKHNFADIYNIHKRLEEECFLSRHWLNRWASVFLFDALIGNIDRHQNNWGVIFRFRLKINNKFKDTAEQVTAEQSPSFDNGTSLGFERLAQELKNWNDDKIFRYISKGTHHARMRMGDDKLSHIAFIRELMSLYPVSRYLNSTINRFSIENFRKKIELLQKIELPVPLSKDRSDFVVKLTNYRLIKLKEVIHEYHRAYS